MGATVHPTTITRPIYLPHHSVDSAHTWSLQQAPPQLLSARPRAIVLANGALVVSGGRPGLGLWVSADGFGRAWESSDIPTRHNQLMADQPALQFCDAFLSANATLGMNVMYLP
jgi:hypothetical protein